MRGTLPPQAYTREVLAHAFNWLQGQTDAVKTLAQTPDTLVSLYLQAKRKGDLSFDSDTPSESFRSQLKTLATDLQQFAPTQTLANPELGSNLNFENSRGGMQVQGPQVQYQSQNQVQSPPSAYNPPLPLQTSNYQAPQAPHPTQRVQTAAAPLTQSSQLDARTLEILTKVRHHLNLSSDGEALRMLVMLGFERIQNIVGS